MSFSSARLLTCRGRMDLLQKYATKYPTVRYATAGADGAMLQGAMKARAAQTRKVGQAVAAARTGSS